ncbi:MAG: MmgE/PrpD family protein, partial [Terriglobales bacterium]
MGTVTAAAGVGLPALAEQGHPAGAAQAFPSTPGLTRYVADFIVNTTYDQIPAEVIARGKNTLLDAFGVGLSGSVSAPGTHIRRYLDKHDLVRESLAGKASVWGTSY